MQKESIYRGTNPLLSFILPFHTEEVTSFYLTISQHEKAKPVIDKGIGECSLSAYTVSVRLSQKDTLSLHSGKAYLQVRVKASGRVFASPITPFNVKEVLKEEII